MKQIALVSVYSPDPSIQDMYSRILYQLMEERKPEENISHKELPIWAEHVQFIGAKPYICWYIIQSIEEKDRPFVGAIYINRDNSIGIGILDRYKRQHYASAALKALMKEHPKIYYYAHINPENHKSKELFKRHGFKYWKTLKGMQDNKFVVVQETYRWLSDDVS